MSTVREKINNALTLFWAKISTVLVRKANIVDNCASTSTEYPLSANQGTQLQTQIDELNTKIGTGLCNANKNGITEYPTQAGCYRVVNGGIAGLPSGNASYGTLLLVDGGTYVMNFYIDAQNTFYWCRTSGFETPKSWDTVNPTMVNGVSAYS